MKSFDRFLLVKLIGLSRQTGRQDALNWEAEYTELGGRMHRNGWPDAPKREAHRPVMQGQPQRDERNNRDNSEGKNNI